MNALNRRWLLAGTNPGDGVAGISLSRDQFVADEAPVPEPADGELLIRSYYFSPDPMNHAWVRGVPGRFEPILPGQPLRGGIAGRVVVSRHPDFAEGDAVSGFLEWSDYNLSTGRDLMDAPLQVIPQDIPLASGLSALGMTGVCAYLSLVDFAAPTPGDLVMISGASGAIGSMAGQIAVLYGARTVGLARGDAKCAFVGELGFNRVVDISAEGWQSRLGDESASGINVFIDNVGGAVLDEALLHMAQGGHIVICGATAHYEQGASISNHLLLAIRGCTMSGFFYFDYEHRWNDARRHLAQWLREGKIRDPLDISYGFDKVPDAALGQFTGANFGRKLVQIADE